LLEQEKDLGTLSILIKKEKKKRKGVLLNELKERYRNCKNCPLWKTRRNFVFGEGNPYAKLMFIGEAPGYDEDVQGKPFVGKAGKLFTKIINAMGLKREDVYITNVVKCHPVKDVKNPHKRGNDRPPTDEEIEKCIHILKKQIEIIKPKIICLLGATALKAILGKKEGIKAMRGKLFKFMGIDTIATFHPAFLLRNPNFKKECWEDIKKIISILKNA